MVMAGSIVVVLASTGSENAAGVSHEGHVCRLGNEGRSKQLSTINACQLTHTTKGPYTNQLANQPANH